MKEGLPMCSKVPSDRLPSHIKAAQLVLDIFRMVRYILVISCVCVYNRIPPIQGLRATQCRLPNKVCNRNDSKK